MMYIPLELALLLHRRNPGTFDVNESDLCLPITPIVPVDCHTITSALSLSAVAFGSIARDVPSFLVTGPMSEGGFDDLVYSFVFDENSSGGRAGPQGG